MARPVVTVDSETDLLHLTRLFVAAGIGAAPVVDANGTPIGVVSKTDLLRELYDRSEPSTRDNLDGPPLEPSGSQPTHAVCQARHIMTATPVVVTEGTSLAEAAGVMAHEHLHRVFVVDERGALSGVLSSSDIVDWLAREDDEDKNR
jgi:CBS domain-containing protein